MTELHARLSDAPGELDRVRQLLEAFAEANDLSADVLFALDIALDEIASNISRHASAGGGIGDVRLRLSVGDSTVEMEFEDDGAPFDPLSLPTPDVSAPLATRKVGGLGVHLVRSLMTEVVYARVANHNRLILRKSFTGPKESKNGSPDS